ncbi:beta-1,6-N-acetylglucosaminyltransferase [Rhizosaccharibacter radicis]|uniref:Glycosyl transferase n=1 Tax=Rhizosaccharibacter radicis TaxID=2782605 RepID=A0ABT1VT56_9PROT|nr:hypothetical protein [Acetobacteraceae bacterium KSS12]
MKIAIGVLAYRAPLVLAETVRHWPSDWQIYVHIDAKAEIAPFAALLDLPNVTILEQRFDALWGGFKVVEAELALMAAANHIDPEVFLLHSDDSVPLMTPARTIRTLEDHQRWIPMVPTDWDVILDRYDAAVCYDIRAINPQHSPGDRRFSADDAASLVGLGALLQRGKIHLDGLFHRSQWKAVFGPDIPYILDRYRADHQMRESFRFSIIPDEMYIPTILGSKVGGSRLPDRYMWADFSMDPKPYLYRELSELAEPLRQEYMFVRKIHEPALARQLLKQASA